MALSLPALTDMVGDLVRRVTDLEAYVASNARRIGDLEGRTRTEIDGLRADTERERWRAKYGKHR